jgi:hypothetical protein
VPVGDQDHSRVAVAVASVLAGAVHQPLDFLPGEIPAGSALGNCQVYSVWRRGLGCWKHRGNLPFLSSNWLTIAPLLHSCKWLSPAVLLHFAVIRPGAARSSRAHQGHLRPLLSGLGGCQSPRSKKAWPQCLPLARGNAGVGGAISFGPG